MAFIVLSRMRVRPGRETALESVIAELYGEMRRSEPGCRLNIMHRSLGGPDAAEGEGAFGAPAGAGSYVFYEVYESASDGEAHTQTPHFARFMTRVRGLIDGPIEVEFLNEITRK